MRFCRRIGVGMVLLVCVPGCSVALQRELQIRQLVSVEDNGGRMLEVDTSAIPADWIQQRTVRDSPQGDISEIKLAPGNAVRVVLLPASK